MKISIKMKKPVLVAPIHEKEKELATPINDAIRAKRAKEQHTKDILDMGFFFSVVFETRKARDIWLKKHGIALHDGEYVLINELDKLNL